ncbi:MAG: 4-hydroxy-tetrahydrodipicolinate reductase [Candidatus Caldatribacteriota bacterium]|nr:4-hydroxy-tetrahydrodipicolinate reductase [Candidatus Caldatribacteriota bacterium]
MINVIVCGGCGKMGSAVARLIHQNEDMKLVGIIESPSHPGIGKDWGISVGLSKTGVIITDNLEEIIQNTNQVVEFTNPQVSLKHLEIVSKYKKAMIMGTTGFSSEEIEKINKSAQDIPFLLSPNMSLGVNLLFKLAAETAAALSNDYDIEIVEAHHRFKKDAPSGTAKKLAQEIAKAKGVSLDKVAIYGREGIIGERKRGEIGIHSIRSGDITGEHTVMFTALGERLELTHKAHSRDTFAYGTIQAIKFIKGKPAGFYEMKDVLKI